MMNMANVKAEFFSAVLMIFLAISTTDVQGKSLSLRIVNVTGESPCQSGLIHEEDAFVVTGHVTSEKINASDSQRVQFTIVGTNFEATVCTVRLSSCHEQDLSYMGCYCQNTGDGEYDVVLRQKANVQYSTAKVKLDYKDDDFSFEMSSSSWRIPKTFYKDTEKLTLEANGIEVDLTSSQCTLPLREGQNTFKYCCGNAPSCDVRITEPDGRESGSTGCYKLTAYGIDESLNYAFSYSVCGVESSQSYTCKGKFAPELFPTTPPPPSLEEDDKEESDKSVESGTIVGVSAAAAAVVLVIVIVLGLWCFRKKQSHAKTNAENPPTYEDTMKGQSTPVSMNTTQLPLPRSHHNVDPEKTAMVFQANEEIEDSHGRPLPNVHSGFNLGKGAGSFKASKPNRQERTRPQSSVTFENETPLTSPSLCDISQTHGMNRTPDGSPKPPTSYTAYNLQRASGKMRDMPNGEGNLERAGNSNDQGCAIDIENLNNNQMDNSNCSNVHVDNSDPDSEGSNNNSGIDNNKVSSNADKGQSSFSDSDQGSGGSGDGNSIGNDKDSSYAYNGQRSVNDQVKVGSNDKASSGANPQSETDADSDQRNVSSGNIKDKDSSNANNGLSSASDKDKGKVEKNGIGSSGTDQQPEPNTDRPLHEGNSDQGSGDSGDGSGIGKDTDRTNACNDQSSDSDNGQCKVEDSGKSGSVTESQSETSDNAIDQENVSSMNASGSDIDESNANNGQSSASDKDKGKVENNGIGSSHTDQQPEPNIDRPLHERNNDQGGGDSGDGSGINKNKDKNRTNACNGQSNGSDNGQGKVEDSGKSDSGTEPQSETSTDESDQKPETKNDRLDSVDESDQDKVGSGKGDSSPDQQSETKLTDLTMSK